MISNICRSIILKAIIILGSNFYLKQIQAQTPEIFIVDSVTNSVNKLLPFDRPFILSVRGQTAQSAFSAYILEWDKNKMDFKRDRNEELIKEELKSSDIVPVKNGNDLYLKGQKADKSFLLLLGHRFDQDLLDEILRINYLIFEGNTDCSNYKLKQLPIKVEEKVRSIPGLERSTLEGISNFAFDWIEIDSAGVPKYNIPKFYAKFYDSKLDTFYRNISILNLDTYSLDEEENLINLDRIFKASDLKTTYLGTLFAFSKRDLFPSISNGLIPFSTNYLNSNADKWDVKSRAKNLKFSILELDKVIQTFDSYQITIENAERIHLSNYLHVLEKYRNDLKKNLETIEVNSKFILDALQKESNLTYSTFIFGNNEIWDLKTRGSYQVIPDFGIATIYAIGNYQNEVIIRPYLGASFYFRPVDKGVPFKSFDKKYRWLHRTSLNLGITLGSISEGEFSSLSNNISLLGGVNYKITRGLGFSFGGALLKRQNSNLAIEEKQFSLNPYLGINLDLDFLNGIQKLTSKVY